MQADNGGTRASVNKVTELMAEIASASDEQSRGIHPSR